MARSGASAARDVVCRRPDRRSRPRRRRRAARAGLEPPRQPVPLVPERLLAGIAFAGDVDADGFDDLLVGACMAAGAKSRCNGGPDGPGPLTQGAGEPDG